MNLFKVLEELMKPNVHIQSSQAINIKQVHEGADLFFGHRNHTLKLVKFLGSVVPTLSQR